jgi:hypothetical protein
MTAYRVYLLDPAGKIASADWLDAATDKDAEALALGLCGPGVPTVELWLGVKRIAVLPCAEPAPKRRRRA